MLNTNNKKLFGRLMLLSATLIWGSSFVLMKNALDSISPHLILSIRFSVAFIVLSLIFFPKFKKIDRSYIISGSIIGTCLFLAYSLQTVGLTNTTPGKNAVLTASYCVIVPFLFWFVSKKRPDFFNISAAILCIVGIALVALKADGGAGSGNAFVKFLSSLKIGSGDTLTILGGFMYAAHIVGLAKLANDKDPVLITIIQFGVCAVLSVATQLIFGTGFSGIKLETNVIFSLIYLTFVCTCLTILMQTIGQKYTPPSEASILLSLESMFGVVFSMLLYKGENPTLRFWIGFLMIFTAIIISETKLQFLRSLKSRLFAKKDSSVISTQE